MKPGAKPDTDNCVESLRRKIEDYERWLRTLDRQVRVLERERQKFSAVVNHTDAGFLLVDSSIKVVWANVVFARRFGKSRDVGALIGLHCNEVLCGQSEVCERCPAPRPFRSGEVAHHEMSLRLDGRMRHLYATAMPIKSPEGKIEQCILMLQDVSDLQVLRQSEEALRASEEQLRQSQKMEAIGRLAGGIAHDFNNLLTAITGYSEFLLSRLDEDGPLRREASQIRKAAHQAAALTSQLLAFGRRQVLQPKVLDLNAVVADLDRMLRRVIGEDVDLVTVQGSDIGRVEADPVQIQQVLMNLVVNARDAMPDGGKITIETAKVELDSSYGWTHPGCSAGSYVMLSVSDTGCGLDEETRAKLFEPFFTTKEQGKGTGLGLSTVYGIIKQSGGNIWVYSEVGRGTTFKIYLPRIEKAEPERAESRREVREVPRGSETVLLVEDDAAVRGLVQEIFEDAGYAVMSACNGVEALALSESYPRLIHLLVTDLIMPQMGGAELAKNLVPLRPEIRVLYLSGYTDSAVFHQGLLKPGSYFLQKPFTPDSLVDKVREILDA